MGIPDVFPQGSVILVRIITDGTEEVAGVFMLGFVLHQVRVGLGAVFASLTLKEGFVAMAEHVLFEFPASLAGVATLLTGEGLDGRMN